MVSMQTGYGWLSASLIVFLTNVPADSRALGQLLDISFYSFVCNLVWRT